MSTFGATDKTWSQNSDFLYAHIDMQKEKEKDNIMKQRGGKQS